MIIKIPLMCRSKKNSQNIIVNPRTHKPMIIQSKLYKQFEQECGCYLLKYRKNISTPVNLKCTFYVKDRRKKRHSKFTKCNTRHFSKIQGNSR